MKKHSILFLAVVTMTLLFSMPVYADKIPWPTDVNGHGVSLGYGNTYSDHSFHNGMDIVSASGTVLYAPFDGVATYYQVVKDQHLISYGNFVSITSLDGKYKVYICHMSAFGMGVQMEYPDLPSAFESGNSSYWVKCGTVRVYEGDVVGRSGGTGKSTGPHLHVSLFLNGSDSTVNPEPYFDKTISAKDHANRVEITSDIPSLYVGETNTFLYSVHSATGKISRSDVRWKAEPSSVLEINNNGDIKGKSAGTATVTAYVPNSDGTYLCRDEKTVTVKQPAISLDKSSVTLYGDDEVVLIPFIDGPDSTVTWKSSNSAHVSVSDGVIKGVGASLTASLSGASVTITATANGVSADCQVTWKPAQLKFTKKDYSINYNGSVNTEVTAVGASTIWYSSSNPDVAKVDETTGKISGVKAGVATITVTAGGDISDQCTVTVNPVVSLNKSKISLYQGAGMTLTAVAKGTSDTIKWTSANSGIATVSNGTVKGVKPGTTTIKATVNGVSKSCSVTVMQCSTTLSRTSVTLMKGKSATLTASVKGPSSKVVWKSSSAAIVSVSSTGKLTAKKAGTASITAVANGVKAVCKVKVENPSVTLNQTDLVVLVGKTASLKATLKGVSGTVKWSSSNSAVVSVSNGKIKGKKAGTAVITAKVSNLKATCKVIVSKTARVRQVSLDGTYTAVVKTDGTLWMSGTNRYGQFGDGTTKDSESFKKIMGGVKSVSVGNGYTAILKTDGSLWMCGLNDYGQLGDGTTTNRKKPVKIMTGVKAVSAAGATTTVLKTDGSLWTFGYNGNGQLGNGTKNNYKTKPAKIMTGVKSVACDGSRTAIIKTDGSLWMCGWNYQRNFVEDPNKDTTVPIKIASNVSSVSISGYNTAFVKTDGSLWMLGLNEYGSFGNGTKTASSVPVKVMTGVKAVSTAYNASAILKKDGTLWMCGSNQDGLFGNGTHSSILVLKPVKVCKSVKYVTLEGGFTTIIKNDYSLWMTGVNSYGRIGYGAKYRTRYTFVRSL